MTISFKDALQAKAATIQTTRNESPKIEEPKAGVFERLEINVSRRRLDIYFTSKPSEGTRKLLKAQGFCYNPDAACWYHKDCEANREFLRQEFGLVELESATKSEEPKKEEPRATKTPEPDSVVNQSGQSQSFEVFKRQTDELVTELNMSPADLMLLAINTLHKEVFSRDS